LEVQYRDWLYKKVDEELQKGEKSEAFQGTLVVAEVDNFRVTKEAIKKAYESKMAKKEKIRQIESSNSRTVHFLFNPGVPTKIQPFTRKYEKLIQGYNVLADFETAEKEAFQKFVEALEAESLPEEEKYPITFGDMPWFQCELTGMSRIALCTADDPFYKSNRPKYYPEVVFINNKS
jgi:hypothetical protein